LFDPREFVVLSRAMAVSTGYHAEARTRSSLGRAYYGLFLAVRAAICTVAKKSVDDNIGHGALTNLLFGTKQDPLIALGAILNDLYDARQKADYKLNPDPAWTRRLSDPKYAELRVKQAEDALRQLPKLDLTPLVGKF
jgi:uncharacterized protein (UPF0332 family)